MGGTPTGVVESGSSDPGSAAVLGNKAGEFSGKLDTVDAPANCTYVRYESDEVSAKCPVTGQPDWYIVTIELRPNSRLPESKSLKLYLQSFATKDGIFCESLADKIALELQSWLQAGSIAVTIKQKARGGITIMSRSVVTPDRNSGGSGSMGSLQPFPQVTSIKEF